MAAAAVLPAAAATGAPTLAGYRLETLLHRTQRSTVWRGVAPDGAAVVVKTPTAETPSARDIARYQWAYDLAREADPRAVVRHLALLRPGSSVALVMEDAGGSALDTLIPEAGFALSRWLELGAALATALGRLHASGVVHKDVNPHNVIVLPGQAELRLIDLGISVRAERSGGDAAPAGAIEGTLAYMSPEQCGRIASPVDQRADLYSLGVTLFQMATGRLPFVFDSPADLAHAHVARAPPRLAELRREFPAVLSDIVARLLAKNADDRYASAQGLAHDLQHCVSELRRCGTVPAFALGQVDATSSFRIPNRLYGRDAERARLLEAIALAGQGARVVVTVAGSSGIGKTALANDVARHVAATARGRVCSGKFDQFGAHLPYLGLLKAMRSLLLRELAEPQEALARRRGELQQALGIHGALLTMALPELQAIVGPQPAVEEIAPRDAERRLHLVVGRLLP